MGSRRATAVRDRISRQIRRRAHDDPPGRRGSGGRRERGPPPGPGNVRGRPPNQERGAAAELHRGDAQAGPRGPDEADQRGSRAAAARRPQRPPARAGGGWGGGPAGGGCGRGGEVKRRLITAAVEQPPPAVRSALLLGQAAAAVTVRRVRLVDGCPVVVQNSWLPCSRFAGLDADPLLDGSLYAMLETRYGVRVVRAKQAVTAATAGEADASALDLNPDEPVLRIARTTYDSSNLVVEYAMSAMRPGYPIETIMQRRPPPDAGAQ